jgi:(p)ppGpp synthase/HD superfamily hydrolase
VIEESRPDQMAIRLYNTVIASGMSGSDANMLVDCYRFAVQRREQVYADPNHPELLHPARSALILMDDMDIRDPPCLAAAILHDSERPDLNASVADVERLAGEVAARIAGQFPPPGLEHGELMERLVVCEPAALAATLAERLDHVRHLHFRPHDEWRAVHRTAVSVLLPVAARCHPRLTQRYQAWCDAFARRLRDRSD